MSEWRSVGRSMVAALVAVLAACQPDVRHEARASTPIAAVPAQPSMPPLDLTVRVLVERNGRRWSAATGETLQSGDFLELLVYLNQPAHLYVVQRIPNGDSEALLPAGEDHLLQSGREYRIPSAADESFQLDANVGEEILYVVMSRGPIAHADAWIPGSHAQPRVADEGPAAVNAAPTAGRPAQHPVALAGTGQSPPQRRDRSSAALRHRTVSSGPIASLRSRLVGCSA